MLSRLRLTTPDEFLNPRRAERLRRLRPFLQSRPLAGYKVGEHALMLNLALRLERVEQVEQSAKLWKHLGSDFDLLWGKVPLFARGLTPLEMAVLGQLIPE